MRLIILVLLATLLTGVVSARCDGREYQRDQLPGRLQGAGGR
jgi:hypothetical protein